MNLKGNNIIKPGTVVFDWITFSQNLLDKAWLFNCLRALDYEEFKYETRVTDDMRWMYLWMGHFLIEFRCMNDKNIFLEKYKTFLDENENIYWYIETVFQKNKKHYICLEANSDLDGECLVLKY